MITPWADNEIDWSDDKRDLELHKKQRAERGFSDYDFWSFDTYISAVLANYAEYAREHNHGYPIGITEQEWDEILEKIQIGFANNAEHSFDDKFKPELLEEALTLFAKWFQNFWD